MEGKPDWLSGFPVQIYCNRGENQMSIAEQLDSLFRESGAGLQREMDRRGPTLARVTNVTDPEKFNRVKCLPVGSENTEETDWCYVMAPMGGKECGQFFFPNVNDLVEIGRAHV